MALENLAEEQQPVVTNMSPEHLSQRIKEKTQELLEGHSRTVDDNINRDGVLGEKLLENLETKSKPAPKKAKSPFAITDKIYSDPEVTKKVYDGFDEIRSKKLLSRFMHQVDMMNQSSKQQRIEFLENELKVLKESAEEPADQQEIESDNNDKSVVGWQDKVINTQLLEQQFPNDGQPKNVPDILSSSAQLYQQRNELYGNSYKRQGQVLEILFPDGIKLETVKDFNRFTVFSTIISKILRYSNDFTVPHDDSILDNITYFSMLLELDRNE